MSWKRNRRSCSCLHQQRCGELPRAASTFQGRNPLFRQNSLLKPTFEDGSTSCKIHKVLLHQRKRILDSLSEKKPQLNHKYFESCTSIPVSRTQAITDATHTKSHMCESVCKIRCLTFAILFQILGLNPSALGKERQKLSVWHLVLKILTDFSELDAQKISE